MKTILHIKRSFQGIVDYEPDVKIQINCTDIAALFLKNALVCMKIGMKRS